MRMWRQAPDRSGEAPFFSITVKKNSRENKDLPIPTQRRKISNQITNHFSLIPKVDSLVWKFQITLKSLQLRKTLHARKHISAQSVTSSDEAEDDTGGGYTIPRLQTGGRVPQAFSLPFYRNDCWSSTRKTQQRNLQGPEILYGAQKEKEENLRFRKVPRKTGSEQRLERAHEGGWWNRVGAWPKRGSKRKQHQARIHPLGPCPLRGDPRRARWASEGAEHWGRRTGPKDSGVWGEGKNLLYPLFSAQQ